MIEPDDRITPAYAKEDGVDFVPMKTWKAFLVQLLNSWCTTCDYVLLTYTLEKHYVSFAFCRSSHEMHSVDLAAYWLMQDCLPLSNMDNQTYIGLELQKQTYR